MASSEFWQRLAASIATETESGAGAEVSRGARGSLKVWMAIDALTVLVSATAATLYELRASPVGGARGFVHGTLIHGRPMSILLALVCGFAVALMITSRRLGLYAPKRFTGYLHEQRLSAQACFTSGLLLTGTLYLVHANDIPRGIVLLTVGLVAAVLALRRLIYRMHLYSGFDRGVGMRNVLIVGTGPEAHALRHHLESLRCLGYSFKGFVDCPSCAENCSAGSPGDVVSTLENMFDHTRKHFVDEIFFTTRCEREVVESVLLKARHHGVDLRLVPDLYGGLAWNNPIEYIGQFPTIPLHCGHVPELGLFIKRVFDIVFSIAALIVFSPLMLAIAIAIKLDSPGPVLYSSERVGKKGNVFRCTKFRTMVRDAEVRRANVLHMNERDYVLFKISNDPRITRLGGWLRKYSLDELPQFLNVLAGDMSVVGPRPPLASEVKEYKLSHLRRLDVTPGITGLWQVQGRQDPSFASYVSLDVTYIDNWSLWLDFKIIVRTVAVVLAGTGV